MDIESVIRNLRNEPTPSRYRDAEIAALLGWTKDSGEFADPSGGKRLRAFWRNPSGEPEKVPLYTSHLGMAQRLALDVAPGQTSGCSWEAGTASAKIGNGPYVESTTPAIALCIAALIHIQYHQPHLPR
ncbi:hypothetical protein [Neorhizobium sp. DT-125]|uniref:hypothetical protein n=1 Tax=Neorhizobium sp. DT-125 TaxID=3396163 RepID=UPI003F1BF1F7